MEHTDHITRFPINEVDLYRRVFEIALDGISICSLDGLYLDVNEAHCRMVGYSYDEMVGMKVIETIHPDYKNHLTNDFMPKVLEKGWVRIDSAMISKDGQKIPVEVHGVVFSHSGKPAFMGIVRDLTARIKAEQDLRASEERYRILSKNVTNGVMVIRNQKLLFANEVLLSMFGYESTTDAIGKDVGIFLHPDFQKIITEKSKAKSDNASQCFFMKENHIVLSEKEFWIKSYWNDITWESEPATLVTLIDVTASKLRMKAIEDERTSLYVENIKLKSTMRDRYKFYDIVGICPAMQKVQELILKASAGDHNVVIYGPSGTGKELVAQTIHQLSSRKDKKFLPVNCGAIPEKLFESEFFGHKKGAFTGAHSDKPGFFDLAHEGTLFLDEVGELSKEHQIKLLRAIDGGGYNAVGDQKMKKSDFRIISATNRRWMDMLAKGIMREDFFYRIHVIPIVLPPLKERVEDIPLLIAHFAKIYGEQKKVKDIPRNIFDTLIRYDWPGNVRELENVIKRYFTLGYVDIPTRNLNKSNIVSDLSVVTENKQLRLTVEAFEKDYIIKVLTQFHWNRGKTSEYLGIPPKTLYRKIQKYRIK